MAGPDDSWGWVPDSWVTPPDVQDPYATPPVEDEGADWRQHFAPAAPEPATPAVWPPPEWATPEAPDVSVFAAEPPRPESMSPSLERVQLDADAGTPWPPPEWLGQPEPQPEGQEPVVQPPPADEVVDIAPTTGTETERLESMRPEDVAAEAAQLETERAQMAAKRKAEAYDQYQDDVARSLADRKQAAAQMQSRLNDLDAEWQAHGQQRIDTGRWWANRSTGDKAMAYIGAGINGFLNPGGRNQTIDAVKDAINRDLEAQRIDLETGRTALNARRGLVADYARITGDLQQAQDAAMVAALGALENQIAAEAAAYDPAGTAAHRAYAMKQQVEAARAQALAKLEADELERRAKILEDERAERELRRKIAADAVDAKDKASRRYLDAKRLAFDKAKHADDENYRLKDLEERRAERIGKLKEGADKDTRERGVWQVRDADGSVWKAPTPKAAEDVNNTIGAAQKITDITNRIIELRRSNPHEWAKINTDAKNEMRSLHGSLLFEVKNAAELGVLSKDDRELVENVIGDDPTGLFSNIKKLETYRNLAIDNTNTKLRHQYGYRGGPWSPEIIEDSEAPPTENEKSESLLSLDADLDLENQESGIGDFALGAIGMSGVKVRQGDVNRILGAASGTGATNKIRNDVFEAQKEELRKVRTRAMDLGDRTKALDALVRSGAKSEDIKDAEAAVAEAAEAVDMLRRIRQKSTPVGKWAAKITEGMFEGPSEEDEE